MCHHVTHISPWILAVFACAVGFFCSIFQRSQWFLRATLVFCMIAYRTEINLIISTTACRYKCVFKKVRAETWQHFRWIDVFNTLKGMYWNQPYTCYCEPVQLILFNGMGTFTRTNSNLLALLCHFALQ